MSIYDAVIAYAKDKGEVLINEPMSAHTTFRIGGGADVYLRPKEGEAIKSILNMCAAREIPVLIIGNGSNILMSDEGFRGVVIDTGSLNQIEVDSGSGIIKCGSGVMLARLAVEAQRAGLTGLEFAHGIPGTVGGAVYINAGAYDGEIADVLVRSWHTEGVLNGTEHCFSYRHSTYMNFKTCILGAEFKLNRGDPGQIQEHMNELSKRRREKQPLDLPSAGSVFKRPEGHFAARLIEEAGLKGLRIGGAEVSVKHAGFIVNVGGASCSDVLRLIEHIKTEILKSSGIQLECEIRII